MVLEKFWVTLFVDLQKIRLRIGGDCSNMQSALQKEDDKEIRRTLQRYQMSLCG